MFRKNPQFIKLSNLELIVLDVVDIIYNPEKDKIYPNIKNILKDLKKIGYKLAIISYNINTIFILERFNLVQFFDYIEIEDYWKNFWEYKTLHSNLEDKDIHAIISNYKTKMFINLMNKSNIDSSKILSFDTSYKLIHAISLSGVFSIYIEKNGLTEKIINYGFTNFLSDKEWYINPNYSLWHKELI